MNSIDLQVHSTASDGSHSPTEVVKMAKDKGVVIISLTDHDAVDGLDEAFSVGQNLGVRVIPGIEISVEEHGTHILGYGINNKDTTLLDYLEEFKKGRVEGAKQMVENLRQAGFTMEWKDVLNEVTGSIIARPHLARAVLNRPENRGKLGGISTIHEFIKEYLGDDSPLYVKRSHISTKDAITTIKNAGGVAVWSHPAIRFQNDHDGLEKFLGELIGWGLEGIEIFTSAHTEDDVEFVQNLAVSKNLFITAGSDFHEEGSHPGDDKGLHSAGFVGDYPTYGFSTEGIIVKLEEAMKNAKSLVGTG